MRERMEEDRILSLLESDPEAGLSLAMDAYGDSVKWIAVNLLGRERREDVEECVAETFVRLWQSRQRFSRDAGQRAGQSAGQRAGQSAGQSGGGQRQPSLRSYTCGIARHVALDMLRRRPSVEISSIDEVEVSVELDFVEEIAESINSQILQEAIEGLTPPDREIFLLRYWLGLRISEIANRLSLSEKQVENKLYRGRLALRRELMERGIVR